MTSNLSQENLAFSLEESKVSASRPWEDREGSTGNFTLSGVSHIQNGEPKHKYTVYWIDVEDQKKISIDVELPDGFTAFDAIRDIIPKFNDCLAQKGANYKLSPDPTLYNLLKASKSGELKTHFPAFDSQAILSKSKIERLGLQRKNEYAVIKNQISSQMIEPCLPESNCQQKEVFEANNETTTTCCWCFTKKKQTHVKVKCESDLKKSLMES